MGYDTKGFLFSDYSFRAGLLVTLTKYEIHELDSLSIIDILKYY